MLKAFASNFKLTRSVILKILERVMSAVQFPGPTKELRPRLLVHARQSGRERIGKPAWLGDAHPSRASPLEHHPLAQTLWLKPLKDFKLLSGLSFLPPSRL